MKVLFVCYGHFDSGLELYNAIAEKIECQLLIQMHENHINQSIIDVNTSDIPLGLMKNVEKTKLFKSITSFFNFDHNSVKFVKYNSLSLRDFRNFKISKIVTDWIKETGFDVVHYYGSSLTWLQQVIFLRGIRRIYTVHDYLPHSGEGEGSCQYKFYMKAIISIRKNNFLLLSKKMMTEFTGYYNIDENRCGFVRFGSFESYTKYGTKKIEQNNQTILFFGRISPYKGIKYLINAADKIKAELPGMKVIIAGSGNFDIDIGKLISDSTYEIHNKYITNEFLAKLLQRCSFVVCPYTDATQSGVVMTAYAFNKPVIATDVGSFKEYIDDGKTGLIVEPKDSGSLSEVFRKLLTNSELLKKMSDNIEKLKGTEFSWKKAALKCIHLYKN